MGTNSNPYPPTGRRLPRAARAIGLAVGLVAFSLALGAVPAGAVVVTVASQHYGVEPVATGYPGSETPLSYEGGPVVHSAAVYAVYWDPTKVSIKPNWQLLLNSFLAAFAREGNALSNLSSAVTEYGDSTGKITGDSLFRGAYTDVTPFPKTGNCSAAGEPCLTDAQIRSQLSEYIKANALPSGIDPAVGQTPVYLVFLPPNVTVCLEGAHEGTNCSDAGADPHQLCSYHSYIPEDPSEGLGTIIYSAQPWDPISECQDGTGTLELPNHFKIFERADVAVNEAATEELAMLTDPMLNGWHDTGADTDEVSDKCRDDFMPLIEGAGEVVEEEFNQEIGGFRFYLNDVFNQAALYNSYAPETCINKVTVDPGFTVPSPVKAGTPVTFNATESVITLGIAKYQWNFGDGTGTEVNCGANTPTEGHTQQECTGAAGVGNPNSVASVVHRYRYGGTYPATLTVTDDGGHLASASADVVVEGESPPPASTSGSSGGTGGTGGSGGSGGAAGSHARSAAAPSVVATILSRSLPVAVRSGLAVRYSVNERVAGYFQVLLATSTADRLGIGGANATGLPSGSAPEKIIATAVLVTTRAGGSVVRLVFSKGAASKLSKLGKVAVTLRLTAHNAATLPQSVTVMHTATLVR